MKMYKLINQDGWSKAEIDYIILLKIIFFLLASRLLMKNQ